MKKSILSRIVRPLLVAGCLAILLLSAAAAQEPFDKGEFAARRARLMERIGNDVAVIFGADSSDLEIRFRQSPDFWYLTGVEEPGSVLVVNGAMKRAFLFAPKRNPGKVAATGPGVRELPKAAEIYGLPIVPIENFYTIFERVSGGGQKLYLQLTPPDDLGYARREISDNNADRMENLVFRREPQINELIASVQKLKPKMQAVDVSPILDDLRWVKSPYEIARMRKAGQIAAEALKETIKGTKPGMFEYEMEATAKFINIKRGARGDAFLPIVASGPNTIVYHYTANNRRMLAGDFVYVDYGADYDYYTSDITRTWPVSEKFTAEQEKWYRCILEASKTIIAAMKPGVSVEDLQKIAEPVYQKHGFLQGYLNSGRYVGHFVGISVHDPGDESKPFVPGVVFNVEPVIEFQDRKIHLRLEDTILITANGAENLTAGAPVELDAIYALMKQQPLGPK